MKVIKQLCIKSYKVVDDDGTEWTAKQGKIYTTSPPIAGNPDITVFSQYWVRVPKDHFVVAEVTDE